jgi:hypothetical protein
MKGIRVRVWKRITIKGSENENNGYGRFHWQSSCSAFSVSKKDVDKVCKYILNQPEHHKTQSYDEEWETFLKFYQTGMPENKGRVD